MFGFTLNDVSAMSIRFGVYLSCLLTRKVPKETAVRNPFLRERVSYVSSQRGWGICTFEAQMREPISVCLNPPAFGRERPKAGGFVRLGCPSGERLGHFVAEGAKPVTDSGDLAVDVWVCTARCPLHRLTDQ